MTDEKQAERNKAAPDHRSARGPLLPDALIWDRYRFKKQPYAMDRLLDLCLRVLSGETDCPPTKPTSRPGGYVAVSLHGLLYTLVYLWGVLRAATPDFLPSLCLREQPEERVWLLGYSVPLFSVSPACTADVMRDLAPAAAAGGFVLSHRVEGEKELFLLTLSRYDCETFSVFRPEPMPLSLVQIVLCAKRDAGLEVVCRTEELLRSFSCEG
ncbi:MAG: hypothetical protein J6125_01890 [Clostridia bacterium]|nr:hypothetical protein [Clostridia bacterium]